MIFFQPPLINLNNSVTEYGLFLLRLEEMKNLVDDVYQLKQETSTMPFIGGSVSFANADQNQLFFLNKNTLTGLTNCTKTTRHHAPCHYVQNQGRLIIQSQENGQKP